MDAGRKVKRCSKDRKKRQKIKALAAKRLIISQHAECQRQLKKEKKLSEVLQRRIKNAEERIFAFKRGKVCTASLTPACKSCSASTLNDVRKISPNFITGMEEILGEGRFGICKRVNFQGSHVCMKEIKANTHAKELVMHEASALSKLCHRSICFLLGIQIVKSPYFLVFNLYTIDGISVSIHDLLTISSLSHSEPLTHKQSVVKLYHSTLNLSAWLRIMIEIAEGLQYVHESGMVHRDLKTDNVVFYEKSQILLPVIVDFGKYEHVGNCSVYSLTKSEKDEYRKRRKHIAPDVVDGISKPSPASDIYSYGRIFKNVICYFPLSLSELPVPVKDIVKMCLKYESADRPSCITIIEVFTLNYKQTEN